MDGGRGALEVAVVAGVPAELQSPIGNHNAAAHSLSYIKREKRREKRRGKKLDKLNESN